MKTKKVELKSEFNTPKNVLFLNKI